ncbi:NAD(P)-dependent oxidoreductase [uncultured Devosia sp.]|uniref:NAD-dependent epimerase/dehydratase family protein n=1 Tax=uncultured Devosia sp. TaxID=211434 RepID=UPI002627F53B|nr:NAD(P)-dependent oxidoreductase [uncultured Devosia sp.]
MRVIVTGASGIVGGSVLATGRRAGHVMVGASRSRAGADMIKVGDYRDVPDGDVLVHLAQPADRNSVDSATPEAALALFEALCARPWRRIVYASSTAVYGQLAGKISEDRSPGGADAYSQVKLASENVCLRRGGVVLRLSNVLSDPPAANTVCSDILGQITRHGPLLVRSAGAQLDLLCASDAGRGFVSAVVGEAVGVFNLAYGQSVSVRQVAQAALAGAGRPDRQILSRIDASPSPEFSLDISRSRHELGWTPQIDPLTMIAAMARQRIAPSDD